MWGAGAIFSDAMKAEEEDNPFRLPPDDQIFRIRDQERQRRAEERERVKTMKVWEKTTASSRVHKNRRVDDGTDETQLAAEAARQTRNQRTEGVSRDTRREKENVSDFVKKKREMFLVQMHLDVQKAEILKLDEKAKQKEEALKKSQQMLDEDVTRFDAFLQNNDQKAHKALKSAEEKTKIKNDKIQKIKHLRSQLSAIQSEIAKFKEQKDECIKFKQFLSKLTPLEWKEKKKEEKTQRKTSRKQSWVKQRMEFFKSKEEAEIKAEEQAMEEKAQENSRGRRRPKREAEEEAKERERELEARRRRIRRKYPTQEAVEAEYLEESSGEEMPLYFEEPKQLLDVFTSLEESNLFLIQNSQDTEQALEELQQKYEEIKRSSGATTNKMKQNISHLEQQISQENARCEQLRQEVSEKHRSSEQEELLKEVGEKVVEVHSVCVNDKEHDPDTQEMLKAIEAKLEELLNFLEEVEETEMGARQVEALEKQKDMDRRKNQRKLRIDQANRKNEERLRASLQRSQAPIHKKVGKQIMFRSAPLFQERREVEEDDGFEENCKDHNVFGIWINKEGIPNAQKPARPA